MTPRTGCVTARDQYHLCRLDSLIITYPSQEGGRLRPASEDEVIVPSDIATPHIDLSWRPLPAKPLLLTASLLVENPGQQKPQPKLEHWMPQIGLKRAPSSASRTGHGEVSRLDTVSIGKDGLGIQDASPGGYADGGTRWESSTAATSTLALRELDGTATTHTPLRTPLSQQPQTPNSGTDTHPHLNIEYDSDADAEEVSPDDEPVLLSVPINRNPLLAIPRRPNVVPLKSKPIKPSPTIKPAASSVREIVKQQTAPNHDEIPVGEKLSLTNPLEKYLAKVRHQRSQEQPREITPQHSRVASSEKDEDKPYKNKPANLKALKGGKKRELSISVPTNFKHVSHIGWDAKSGFQSAGVDSSWLTVTNPIGVHGVRANTHNEVLGDTALAIDHHGASKRDRARGVKVGGVAPPQTAPPAPPKPPITRLRPHRVPPPLPSPPASPISQPPREPSSPPSLFLTLAGESAQRSHLIASLRAKAKEKPPPPIPKRVDNNHTREEPADAVTVPISTVPSSVRGKRNLGQRVMGEPVPMEVPTFTSPQEGEDINDGLYPPLNAVEAGVALPHEDPANVQIPVTGDTLEIPGAHLLSLKSASKPQHPHGSIETGDVVTLALSGLVEHATSTESTTHPNNQKPEGTGHTIIKHEAAARTIQQAWRVFRKRELAAATIQRAWRAHNRLTSVSASNRGSYFSVLPPQAFDNSVTTRNDISGSVSLLKGDPIGGGGLCDLYLGFHQTHGKVALKRPRVAYYDPSDIRHFHREAEVWCQISHPNILPFLGTCTIKQNIYLVSPFHQNGDLFRCIQKGMTLNKNKILREVAGAVVHLHSLGIVHGDIKAQNVLLSDSHAPLLCDLGMAKILSTMVTSTDGKGRGSTRWMAPELFDNQPKTMGSDVYAFGMTIAEVLSGKPPLAHVLDYAVVAQVLNKNARPLPSPSSGLDGKSYSNLWAAATTCWATNIEDRPTMNHVLDLLA